MKLDFFWQKSGVFINWISFWVFSAWFSVVLYTVRCSARNSLSRQVISIRRILREWERCYLSANVIYKRAEKARWAVHTQNHAGAKNTVAEKKKKRRRMTIKSNLNFWNFFFSHLWNPVWFTHSGVLRRYAFMCQAWSPCRVRDFKTNVTLKGRKMTNNKEFVLLIY